MSSLQLQSDRRWVFAHGVWMTGGRRAVYLGEGRRVEAKVRGTLVRLQGGGSGLIYPSKHWAFGEIVSVLRSKVVLIDNINTMSGTVKTMVEVHVGLRRVSAVAWVLRDRNAGFVIEDGVWRGSRAS